MNNLYIQRQGNFTFSFSEEIDTAEYDDFVKHCCLDGITAQEGFQLKNYILSAKEHLEQVIDYPIREVNVTYEGEFTREPIELPVAKLSSRISGLSFYEGDKYITIGIDHGHEIESKGHSIYITINPPDPKQYNYSDITRLSFSFRGSFLAYPLPHALRQALRLHVASMWEFRGEKGTIKAYELEEYERLIFPYKQIRI
ncbi:hypothetical protein [Bartonella sp. DGB1]|uniref:hypothetical protein n=1 Tax=Bartonella sp. DGB1 TaxID=3239807 RepID=UPI00352575EF